MKNVLLFGLAILVLIALFGDGGLEVSPTVSPNLQFKPSLEFKPNVSYAPDNSTTHIDTNIERQTIIVQAAPNAQVGGVTAVDPQGNGQACQPAPGETVVQAPDMKGACVIQDAAGNRFFVNALGVRWLLGATVPPLQPSAAPLQPAVAPTVEQMQAAYLRNGGRLPLTWYWFSDDRKRQFLADRPETWQ